MPLVNIKVMRAVCREKKQEMILRVTEIVAEIERVPSPRKNCSLTPVRHRRGRFRELGQGGMAITEEMFKAALKG